MYDYYFDGLGLTIYTPSGSVYIQGEEGAQLYDELEVLYLNDDDDDDVLSADEKVERVLQEYEHVCE